MTGFGKPNDERNPPLPLHGDGGCDFASRGSGPADSGQNFPSHYSSADFSSPFASVANSPLENMHATHQFYSRVPRTANHQMTGLMGFNTLQSPQIDPNLSNHRGSLSNLDVQPSGFHHTQANVNTTRTESKAAGGYQKNVMDGQAEGSIINWSQIRESPLGCGTSASHQSTGFLETGVRNDVRVNAFYPRQVDGNFLTLGMGGNPEGRAKTKSGPPEVVSKLVNVGPQSSSTQIQPATHLSSFHGYPGCFPSTVFKFSGWTSSNNDDIAMQSAVSGSSSNPYLSPQMPETLKQYDFSENNAKNTDLAFKTCQPTPVSTQPARGLPWSSQSISPGNVSSSFGSHCSRLGDSSVQHDYLGHLSAPYKVSSAQPFGSSNNPKETNLLIAEGSTKKPATCAPFPRRLGVQIDDAAATQSARGNLLPTNKRRQTGSNEHQSLNSGRLQRTKKLPRPISGQHQDDLAAQFNFQRPSLLTGQPQHGIPTQFPKDLARVDHTTGQALPNSKAVMPSHVCGVIDQPSLKRRANETPSVPSWGQHRKSVTPSEHSVSGIPDIQTPTPTSPHTKWTGVESPPPPTGYRCMLCKRDLSFTAEGPINQPAIPPVVAVLPCGHTFHDQCLQNITPQDQSKDPPCIPCAIGETET
ncbi:hypothetical protein ACH5RR_008319 [Cinchona calisaya]|uniref:RING-type domain-containing protein n=1 Tax=Cinchona calisaya TaxID=153742 RepID=A0ABD3ADY7_9GENT